MIDFDFTCSLICFQFRWYLCIRRRYKRRRRRKMSAIVVFAFSSRRHNHKEKEETRHHPPRTKEGEESRKTKKQTHSAIASTNSPCSSSVQLSLDFVMVYSFLALMFTSSCSSFSILLLVLFVVSSSFVVISPPALKFGRFPPPPPKRYSRDISKRGGKFSLERSLSTTKEEALMPTIENGQITKTEERRSLNEGDQTAEKADDVIKAARCFFSFCASSSYYLIW